MNWFGSKSEGVIKPSGERLLLLLHSFEHNVETEGVGAEFRKLTGFTDLVVVGALGVDSTGERALDRAHTPIVFKLSQGAQTQV